MSNVEYRCPICQSRLFAAPGGTKLKCPRHTEQVYVQVEAYDGPDFLYIDETGKTVSSDKIGPQNERQSIADRGEITVDPDAELVATRQLYENMTGEAADKRWGSARIRDELQEWLTSSKDDAGEVKEQSDTSSEDNEAPEEPSNDGVEVDAIPPEDQ